MNKLIAVFYFVLSLYGFDIGNTIIDRVNTGGGQALHSQVVAQPGFARFECVRSASGRCYYTLYPRECVSSGPNGKRMNGCPTQPLEHFAVAKGASRQITGVQRYALCVSADERIPGPDCAMPAPIAAR